MKLKQVIFELDGMELPLVFSTCLSHGDATISQNAKSAGYCEKNAK